jgi:hypothetical protein
MYARTPAGARPEPGRTGDEPLSPIAVGAPSRGPWKLPMGHETAPHRFLSRVNWPHPGIVLNTPPSFDRSQNDKVFCVIKSKFFRKNPLLAHRLQLAPTSYACVEGALRWHL